MDLNSSLMRFILLQTSFSPSPLLHSLLLLNGLAASKSTTLHNIHLNSQ